MAAMAQGVAKINEKRAAASKKMASPKEKAPSSTKDKTLPPPSKEGTPPPPPPPKEKTPPPPPPKENTPPPPPPPPRRNLGPTIKEGGHTLPLSQIPPLVPVGKGKEKVGERRRRGSSSDSGSGQPSPKRARRGEKLAPDWDVRQGDILAESPTLALEFFNKSIIMAEYERVASRANANVDAAIATNLADLRVNIMAKISRDLIYATNCSVLSRENQELKDEKQDLIYAAEKAKKDAEWHKGAAASAERDRAAAIAEKDKAEEEHRQKEKNFAESKRILEENCRKFENTIRQHNRWMDEERLKTTEALNQRDEARRELEKAEIAKTNITAKAAKAIADFKTSEEGVAWVQQDLSENLVYSTAEIMSFVDSQVPGVDWTENPMCNMLLALRQPVVAPSGEVAANGAQEAVVDPAAPSEGVNPQEGS